jgi:hypothetical protein
MLVVKVGTALGFMARGVPVAHVGVLPSVV